MPEHHECVMSSAMNIMGQFGVDAVHIAPLLLFILKAASHTSKCSGSRRGSQPPAGGRFLPFCFALLAWGRENKRQSLSSFSRWPHDQDRQFRSVEEAIGDTAHHPAFQPMPTMGGDGNQVAAPATCGSLPLFSWLRLAQQGACNVCFECDRPADGDSQFLRHRLPALRHLRQVGPGTCLCPLH